MTAQQSKNAKLSDIIVRDTWDGEALRIAFQSGADALENDIHHINALNVFPVPDGDTGTNMSLTVRAAIEALKGASLSSAGDVAQRISHGSLMGARGNSGVILYQILNGLAESIGDAPTIDGAAMAQALRVASNAAWDAVVSPVEGTMLSVIRAAAGGAEDAASRGDSPGKVAVNALHAAQEALERTPDQLPILKQAGVVDAGGQGIVTLLAGMCGMVDTLHHTDVSQVGAAMGFLDDADITHGIDEYGFCINFLILGTKLDKKAFQQRMRDQSSSIVVVGNEATLNVHLHAENPGNILKIAMEFGDIDKISIDNMTLQTRALLSQRDRQETGVPQSSEAAAKQTGIAVIAIATGDGLVSALRGMGASLVINGGPSMNPSVGDLVAAIDSVDESNVILLPNDPNIISTSERATSLCQKQVVVVPTRSVIEGLSALSAFSFAQSIDTNAQSMTEARTFVHSVSVTTATRDANIDGIIIRNGQYLVLVDEVVSLAGDDLIELVLRGIAQAGVADAELFTIFTGEPADDRLGEQIQSVLATQYPDIELDVVEGGQPYYQLLIAIE